MKNIALYLLSVVVLFVTTLPAHAGIMVKKAAAVQSVQVKATTGSNVGDASVISIAEQLNSPSGVFERWMHNGTIGTFALLFGILGFLAPIFSIAAILFGYLGMKSSCRSRGLAIAGFVLGMAVLVITIFGGFTSLPIF